MMSAETVSSDQAINLSGRRMLVTGGGGFIGSHLVEHLVRTGCEVRAFARYTSRGTAGFLDESEVAADVEIVLGDLRDGDAVRAAAAGVDTIFHLGALIGIPYSYIHPQETVETNVIGTLNVLLAARDGDVRRVIQTSTSEVYGTAQTVPMSETHPLRGQSPYAASKIGADQLAESFHLSYGVPVVTLRPFNTYGPRQSARAVIPTIIVQGLSGDTVELGNLGPSRDFTFVSDTVEGFALAALRDQAVGRTINLGTSEDVRIGELVPIIGEILGKQLEPSLDPARERPGGSEVERLLSDNTLARELLSWAPQVALREGLERTCEWIAGHLDFYGAHRYAV
jgi:NAD dependent epimerase/dehydratase